MLDPRSIILILSALSLLMALVLFTMPASIRDRLGGTRHWSAGMLLLSVASLLYGLRGIAPDVLTLTAANLGALSAMALIYAGGRRFFDKPHTNGQLALIVISASLAMNYYTYVQEVFAARAIIFSAVNASLLFLFGNDIVRHRPRGEGRSRFPYLFTCTSVYLDALISGLRIASTLVTPPSDDLFDPTLINVLYFSAHSLIAVCVSVGFVLMLNERLHALLEHQLSHDALTNAFSRGMITELAQRELAAGRTPTSLLLLDVDHFKAVNDTLGHQTGDAVLQHFVRTLEGSLRPTESLGRYGGEEFILLLRNANAEQAGIIAERLRRHVAGTPYPTMSGPYPLTVSIGCATARLGEPLEQLLRRADTALYQAKGNGRNRVEHS